MGFGVDTFGTDFAAYLAEEYSLIGGIDKRLKKIEGSPDIYRGKERKK